VPVQLRLGLPFQQCSWYIWEWKICEWHICEDGHGQGFTCRHLVATDQTSSWLWQTLCRTRAGLQRTCSQCADTSFLVRSTRCRTEGKKRLSSLQEPRGSYVRFLWCGRFVKSCSRHHYHYLRK